MKKIDNVYFINATLSGNVHEMIDSSELIILGKAYSRVTAYFQTNRSEIISDRLKSRGLNPGVKLKSVGNLGRRCAVNDLKAALIEVFLFLVLPSKNSLFVFSYVNMFSCHAINFFARLLNKRVILCCHNELEVVSKPKPKKKDYWEWLIYRFYTQTKLAKNLFLMVLGDNIRTAYGRYVIAKKTEKVFSVEHPYFVANKKKCLVENNYGDILKIGVIGFVSKTKDRGFENIVKLAQKLESIPNVEIWLISKVDKDIVNLFPSNVRVCGIPGEFLPREEYDRLINLLDFIYVPYPDESFQFTASGAILEAIVKNKILLMHHNHFINHLVKLYGSFGCFVDALSEDELSVFIKNKNHEDLILKMQTLIKKLEPEAMVEHYCEKINAKFIDGV